MVIKFGETYVFYDVFSNPYIDDNNIEVYRFKKTRLRSGL